MQGRTQVSAIVVMVGAVALFALMDAGMKWLSPHYPPMQVTAMRALASLPFVLAYVAWRGPRARLFAIRWPLHLLRGAISVIMLVSFVVGLQRLPLASAYAIFFVAPLLITALSAPVLGERVGRARWTAIATGLLGVLIALRPSSVGFSLLGGLAILISAICYAISAVTIRIVGRTDSTESLMFWMITLLAAAATSLALPHWQAVDPHHYGVIAAVGLCGFCGQFGITYAFKHGEVSAIAPFEYSALLWGVLLDWFVWHSVADRYVYLGAAIVVASGWYIIRHERTHVECEHP